MPVVKMPVSEKGKEKETLPAVSTEKKPDMGAEQIKEQAKEPKKSRKREASLYQKMFGSRKR